jgi:hypothetical protein
MQRRMDYPTQAMSGFFDILSSCVDPRFAKLTSKQKQRVILQVMKEYGLAKRTRTKKAIPVWTATRKLRYQLYGRREKAYDIHPRYPEVILRAVRRLFREQEYICLEDGWDFFRIRLPDIFECEYQHCLRWMRSDYMLLENKDAFSRQALQKAKAVLCASAITICAADMNTRIHERVIKIRKRRLKRRIRRELRRTAQAGTPDNVTVPVTEAMAEAKLQERTRLAE